MNQTVSGAALTCMFVAALLCFSLPFALFMFYKNRYKAKISSFMWGVGVFIIFAFILEQVPHYLFLVLKSPLQSFITNNNLAYILYGAVIAGLFEETGRLVAYKFLIKKNLNKENALMYGAGHGGTEAILLGGVTMVSNLILSFAVNSIGTEKYISMLPAESQSNMRELMPVFLNTDAITYLVSGVDYLLVIISSIALSVIVYKAVTTQGRFCYYPIAIGLHFLIAIPSGLYQKGFINLLTSETIMVVLVALIAYFAYGLYHQEESSSPTV